MKINFKLILPILFFLMNFTGVCLASDLKSFDDEPFRKKERVITKESIKNIISGYGLHTPVNIGKPDLIYKIDVFPRFLLKEESVDYLYAFLNKHDLRELAFIEMIQRVVNKTIYLFSTQTDDKFWTESKVEKTLSAPPLYINNLGLYYEINILKNHLIFCVRIYNHETYLNRQYDISVDSSGVVKFISRYDNGNLNINDNYIGNLNEIIKEENLTTTEENITAIIRLIERQGIFGKEAPLLIKKAVLDNNDLVISKELIDEGHEYIFKCLEDNFFTPTIERTANGFKVKYITLYVSRYDYSVFHSLFTKTVIIGTNGEIVSEEKEEIKCD